jgi:sulfur-carrier protein
MVTVVLPAHLRLLARVQGDVEVEVRGVPTQASVLDALEARYPMLRGTLRDQNTHVRRPFIRFFACNEDISLQSANTPLPEAVAAGREPFFIVGALAGG